MGLTRRVATYNTNATVRQILDSVLTFHSTRQPPLNDMKGIKEQHSLAKSSCWGFALFLSWLLIGCVCPPDQKLGEMRLAKPQFLSLSGTESMTYTNSSTTQTLVLRGEPVEYNVEKLLVATLCQKTPVDIQFSYYESVPFATRRYKSSGIRLEELRYTYKVFDPAQGDTTSYVDMLQIWGMQLDMSVLVSDRGKPTARSLPLLRDKAAIRVVADTTINNRSFQQVYRQAVNPTVCFTSTRGVIAFYRDGAWWLQTGFQ